MSLLRDLYGRHVIESPKAQHLLLGGFNFGRRRLADVRALKGMVTARPGIPTNIYYGTVQKTGTHWFKAIFDDPRIRRLSGLHSFPGHRYESDQFMTSFPRHHFVPGLFISYGLYEEIRKPADYRTFYVTRDPRNIVVSWYFSARDTHRLVGRVVIDRPALRARSFEDGLKYSIEQLAYKFSFMRSWAYAAPTDPNVLLVRFEDVTRDPFAGFRAIFDHCRIPVSDALLREVLADYTKEKMRQIDEDRPWWRQRTLSTDSHYRPEASSWRDAFTPALHEHFANVNGNLLSLLGYADDPSLRP